MPACQLASLPSVWPVWPESCSATARLTGRREAGDGGDDGDGGGDGGGDDGDGDGDGGGGEAAADGGVEREIARSRESRVRAIDACLPLKRRACSEARHVQPRAAWCGSAGPTQRAAAAARPAGRPLALGSSRRGLAAAPSTTAITRTSTVRFNRFIFLFFSRVLPFCLPRRPTFSRASRRAIMSAGRAQPKLSKAQSFPLSAEQHGAAPCWRLFITTLHPAYPPPHDVPS